MSEHAFEEIRGRIATLDGQLEAEVRHEATERKRVEQTIQRQAYIRGLRQGYIDILLNAGEPTWSANTEG